RLDYDFAQHLPRAKQLKGFRRLLQRQGAVDYGLQFSVACPIQSRFQICAVAAIAADDALLLDKQWPEIQRYIAARSCAAGDDRSTSRQAGEKLLKDLSTDMFHHQI